MNRLLLQKQSIRTFRKMAITHQYPTAESETGKLINEHKKYIPQLYARPPLVIAKGVNDKLYDIEGKEYIDFTAGIAVTSLGHGNKEIQKIISEQSALLMHCSNIFYSEPYLRLIKSLIDNTIKFGGMQDASQVYLGNSGAEANEAALKFARKYGSTKNPAKNEIICFTNSFHGRTMGALTVTSNEHYKTSFAPLIPNVFQAETENIESVKRVINDNTCAIIIEPIQGEGGITAISEEFCTELRKLADKHDALLIYDEIQCGLGRSGKYWAHAHFSKDAHPDIISSAKTLGNGFPISATIINEKVNQVLKKGDHGSTYSGNPLGCAVADYVVNTIASEELLQKVNDKSALYLKHFDLLKKKYPGLITNTGGKGLMIGIQFAHDPAAMVEAARLRGLLILTAGANYVRFVPALTVEDETIESGMKIFEECVAEVFKEFI